MNSGFHLRLDSLIVQVSYTGGPPNRPIGWSRRERCRAGGGTGHLEEAGVSASSLLDGVRALAVRVAAREGLVVEDVVVVPAGRRRVLRVVLDLPEEQTGGVPLDAVAGASQALSAALDDADLMGGAPYVLEVSSPGVGRPLTERRHWARARERMVVVGVRDGDAIRGRLSEVDDDGLTFDDGRRLGWAEVDRGRVEVEFNRPAIDTAIDPAPGGDP
jgi:ribosome maturation factor RimP